MFTQNYAYLIHLKSRNTSNTWTLYYKKQYSWASKVFC